MLLWGTRHFRRKYFAMTLDYSYRKVFVIVQYRSSMLEQIFGVIVYHLLWAFLSVDDYLIAPTFYHTYYINYPPNISVNEIFKFIRLINNENKGGTTTFLGVGFKTKPPSTKHPPIRFFGLGSLTNGRRRGPINHQWWNVEVSWVHMPLCNVVKDDLSLKQSLFVWG